tara:strand:- start:870 stop:1415 length:546 start_codon:yes stop_codon:yes gene_type:complete
MVKKKTKKKVLTIPSIKRSAISSLVNDKKKIPVPWFEAYVAQTVKAIEEAFRYKAKRIILTGIKGDIKKGKFTLLEWPKMIEIIQEAIENDKIKGATWETIEERRISIDYIDELVKRADKDTHLIISSCPEFHFENLLQKCGDNRNIHLTFARNNDINQLFSVKRKGKRLKKEKKKKTKRK